MALNPAQLHHCLTTAIAEHMVDYNGHLNTAAYALLFEDAARSLFSVLDLDNDYRTRTNHAVFAAESHTTFLQEVLSTHRVSIFVQLLNVQSRVIHCMYHMWNEARELWAARQEIVYVHVNLQGRKATPIPARQRDLLQVMQEKHAPLPRIDVGRDIKMVGSG